MSIISSTKLLNATPTFYAVTDIFTLSVAYKKQTTYLLMEMLIHTTSTSPYSWTKKILQEILPSILTSTCFNDDNLPFEKEVENTEIGHLFEHILLEYLCMEKLSHGYDEAIFSGRTNWNWKKEKEGIFHIIIDSGVHESIFFPKAIEKSMILLHGILAPLYLSENVTT